MRKIIKTAVFTISDRCSKGEREDLSGKLIINLLKEESLYDICYYRIIPDEQMVIEQALIACVDTIGPDVILTTGGTGFGPRDVTPEATMAVSEKIVPGIPELLRAEGVKDNPMAVLSRSAAVIRKQSLIINLPGSPKAIKESLHLILNLLPHSVCMIKGADHT